MADDAGALLVRSGLVSSNALDDARARVASMGGTLGEQLVTSGAITDDELTDFYRSRLLVPQVNPNTLARLTPKVVASIPSDMAIELRAIPVSLDRDNNLTVAMSDPSDRHAVDEIAFFTGAYIVRAVATQMQIAWCLAHYYGHVTALGQRLLRASQSSAPIKAAISAVAGRGPRVKGLTGKVNATRHRAVAPVTGPVDVLRPNSGELDLRPLEDAGAGLTRAARAGQGPAVPPPAGTESASAAGAGGPVTAKVVSPGNAAGAGSKRTVGPVTATGSPSAKRTTPAKGASSAGAAGAAPSTAAGPATPKPAKPASAAGPAGAAPSTAAGPATPKPAKPASAAGAAPSTATGPATTQPAQPANAAGAAPSTATGPATTQPAQPASAAGPAGAAPSMAAGPAPPKSAQPANAAAPSMAAGPATPKPAQPAGAAGAAPSMAAGPAPAKSAKPANAAAPSTAAGPATPKPAQPASVANAAGAAPSTAAGPATTKSAGPATGAAGAGAAGRAAPAGAATAKLASPESAASSTPATQAVSGPTSAGAAAGTASPPARPAVATGDSSSDAAGSGPPTARPGVAPSPAASNASAARTGVTSAPEPSAAGTRGAPDAAPPPRADATPPPAARSPSTPAPSAPAGAPRAPVLAAGPNAPTLIPGVFPAMDEGLPRPMLDDALPTPALDDALPTPVLDDESSARMSISPDILVDSEDAPEEPRARSISGEIREAVRRAPSIKPPRPHAGEDDSGPLITIERGGDDVAGSRPALPRRRAVKSDPPELYARAGEVDLKTSGDRAIDLDEPRIVIDEDALAPPTGRIDARTAALDAAAPPVTTIDLADDADTGAVIRERVVDLESQPILLDRLRPAPDQARAVAEPAAPAAPAPAGQDDDEDDDTGEIEVVVLDAPKRPRPERRTRIGVPPAPASARPYHDTEATGVPALIEHHDVDRTTEAFEDPTKVDLRAAPPGDDTPSDQLAAPPAPDSDLDTNPRLVAPPPAAAAPAPIGPRTGSIPRALIVDDGDDDDDDGDDDDDDGDDDDDSEPHTAEMTAVELDDAIPERTTEILPELLRRRPAYDAVDDGWGPPGTTIPPPLLGAIPGSDDDDEHAGAIPMPNVDSSPLIVSPPSPAEPEGKSLIRALEEATARAIEVIRQLERTQGRDEIVDLMIAYLAETHHRAGFLVTRHPASRGAVELGLFAVTPQPAAMPSAILRLDRPSTLQDVVGTRLPYRGPMHDDASRSFLISILGACPPEILLVPVAVRERVVGVLFGEHRLRHTFDDQLALAARAAGMAFERILRARRG